MDRERPAYSSFKKPIRSVLERSAESHWKGSAQYAPKRCFSATSSAMFVPTAPIADDCSMVILLENVEFTPYLCFSLICNVQVNLDLTRNPNVVRQGQDISRNKKCFGIYLKAFSVSLIFCTKQKSIIYLAHLIWFKEK